mmetsp:Transcript_33765/g.54711  ORF Transcript_33765/g.54711 Transcript_33765/m.54711 type:complete len:218 (+) Transcript_33765:1293-1946(+)
MYQRLFGCSTTFSLAHAHRFCSFSSKSASLSWCVRRMVRISSTWGRHPSPITSPSDAELGGFSFRVLRMVWAAASRSLLGLTFRSGEVVEHNTAAMSLSFTTDNAKSKSWRGFIVAAVSMVDSRSRSRNCPSSPWSLRRTSAAPTPSSSSTASCLASISDTFFKGRRIDKRSRRPPNGVCVRSRAHSSDPLDLPLNVWHSSRFRCTASSTRRNSLAS